MGDNQLKLTLEELRDKVQQVGPVWLYYPDEYECLAKYARYSNGPILEVGCAFGGSAAILVLSSNLEMVTSVDPFGEMIDGMLPNPHKVYEKVVEVLGENWKRWSLWQVTSQVAALSYKDKTFGLVFLDGNHTYEAVRSDKDWWLPKLRKGGYLILHDSNMIDTPHDGYCMGYSGPTQVSKELMADKRVKLIETAYSCTVWEVL